MKKPKNVAMIGAGIAGIAAALRLRKQGLEVTVFEANEKLGGKMAEVIGNGFRFDRGPTVLTKPEYVEELFSLFGKSASDYWKHKPVDPIFKYFFEDGTVINSSRNREQFADEIAEKTADSKESIFKFLDDVEKTHHLTDEVFLQRSLHQFKNYLDWPTARGILNFGKVDVFRSMNTANQKRFKDQKVIDIFNRYASYNGSNPYWAPATLNVIAHYEITLGTYFSEGGIYTIIDALKKLAIEQGITFRSNTPVKEIIYSGNTVTGVRTDSGQEPFDVVVSNIDVYNTYKQLLPEFKAPKRFLEQPRSSSVIVFYWGIQREFPELGLHNMFLTDDAKAEYQHLFELNKPYHDPTIHMTISSKMNASDAPAGCENWAALISVPHDSGQDWDEWIAEARKNVLAKLSRILNTDVEKLIVFEDILDPRKVNVETNAAFGAVFGNASNSMFSAFLRHPNFSPKIENLFFCGGTAHPGPGIPLCLLSAKIASELIAEKFVSRQSK
ncbi:MAG: phytoene desaturase [Flavobacteriales bacterium]|nr:phytoene desaturase [Flavobacteriales bacterium]MCB9192306.1 phytoene desaturase [Flavobacteriales bacterium]MCB9203752.1 phytoene desaturase [Flavobacteriales bacterium]